MTATIRAFGAGETVTLRHKTTHTPRQFDEYGNLIYRFVDQVLTGVAIWPESTSETIQQVERSTTIYVMAVPAGVDVDSNDVLVWRGVEWEIQAEAEQYRSPLTGTQLQEVRFRRTEG